MVVKTLFAFFLIFTLCRFLDQALCGICTSKPMIYDPALTPIKRRKNSSNSDQGGVTDSDYDSEKLSPNSDRAKMAKMMRQECASLYSRKELRSSATTSRSVTETNTERYNYQGLAAAHSQQQKQGQLQQGRLGISNSRGTIGRKTIRQAFEFEEEKKSARGNNYQLISLKEEDNAYQLNDPHKGRSPGVRGVSNGPECRDTACQTFFTLKRHQMSRSRSFHGVFQLQSPQQSYAMMKKRWEQPPQRLPSPAELFSNQPRKQQPPLLLLEAHQQQPQQPNLMMMARANSAREGKTLPYYTKEQLTLLSSRHFHQGQYNHQRQLMSEVAESSTQIGHKRKG